MHFPIIFFALLSALPLIATSGIPLVVSPGINISTNTNVTAHLPPCTDLQGSRAPTIPCYTKLGVNSFFDNYNLTSAEVCAPYQSILGTCLLPTIYLVAGVNCVNVSLGVSECTPFDCANLTSTACPAPTYNDTAAAQGAQEWYAAFTLSTLHTFIASWATAINASTSRPAISAAVNPRVGNTATMLTVALIQKYGINFNADNALIRLLNLPTKTHQQTYGNPRIRGESSTLPAEKWQPLLHSRLQDVLDMAMDDFGVFMGAVGTGTFATRGLAGASELKEKLAGANDSSTLKSSSAHTYTATASLHSAMSTRVTVSPGTPHSTSLTHSSASALASVTAHRPIEDQTGPWG